LAGIGSKKSSVQKFDSQKFDTKFGSKFDSKIAVQLRKFEEN
jgi:hypothetical protein